MHNRPIVSTALAELVTAVRPVVDSRGGWRQTAWRVGRELEQHLPSPDVLTLEQRSVDGERYLVEAGARRNEAGEVRGFAPPADIHYVRNTGEGTAISIHIYGTDVTRIGSSGRRNYDQPVVPTAHEGFVTR